MTSNPRVPVDQAVRNECLDTERSFIVTAPAGSGKTSLLTQRTLNLLSKVSEPESVLCITFTRKAAAEMRQRVIAALTEAATKPEPEPGNAQTTWRLAKAVLKRDVEHQWHLIENPARLKITTIDGLCRSIANQLPLSAGVGLGMQNLELPEQSYRQAALDTIGWLERPSSPYYQPLRLLLKALDGDTARLEALFSHLLAKRDQWLELLLESRDQRPRLQGHIQALVTDELTVASELLKPFAGDLCHLAQQCGGNLAREGNDSDLADLQHLADLPPATADALPMWRTLANLLLTTQGKWRKSLNKNQGVPSGSNKAEKEAAAPLKQLASECLAAANATVGLEEQMALVQILPPAVFTDNDWQMLEALTLLLPLLAGHLKAHFAEQNAVDFIEISQAAISALDDEDIGDALLRLDYQIQHILVDEFQDTSQTQLQLLRRLTNGWSPEDGRTLFLVGDGMQSCYGFRGAEVGLFLEVRELGINNIRPEPRALTCNFRSQPGVVDWVNQSFQNAFPQSDDIARGAVAYTPAIAFRPAPEAQTNHVHCYGLIEREHTDARVQEAHQVVSLIRNTQAHYPGDSIAVLVRGRGHLVEISSALEKAGLVAQATEIEPLANRQAIIDLISLTRAMLYPHDRLAWFSVLRAPWCALSPEAMLRLAELLDQEPAPEPLLSWLLRAELSQVTPEPDTLESLTRLQGILQIAWQQRRRKRLSQWLQGIWVALGGPGGLLEPSDLANAEAYWQLLDEYESAGYVADWQAFSQAIQQLYAAPASQADPNLQIMTIHKSKGLEFDHVIIPGLDKIGRADSKALFLWHQRVSHQGDDLLLMAPLNRNSSQQPNLYEFIQKENSHKSRYEGVRLLYVGCTRAIKQLHLLAKLNWDEKKDCLKDPASSSLAGSIWPSFKDQMLLIEDAEIAPSAKKDPSMDPNWHMIRRVVSNHDSAIGNLGLLRDFRSPEFGSENNTPDLPAQANLEARIQGTVMHQLLELLSATGIEAWDASKLAKQAPRIKAWFEQLGLAGTRRRVEELLDCAKSLLSSDTARWLLSNQHAQAAAELPLLDAANDNLYVIDRTFIDQGTRWIIDYKTSRPSPDQPLAMFLAQEAEHYRAQLAGYQRLFESIEPTPVKLGLYFPYIDQLEIIDPELSTNEE